MIKRFTVLYLLLTFPLDVFASVCQSIMVPAIEDFGEKENDASTHWTVSGIEVKSYGELRETVHSHIWRDIYFVNRHGKLYVSGTKMSSYTISSLDMEQGSSKVVLEVLPFGDHSLIINGDVLADVTAAKAVIMTTLDRAQCKGDTSLWSFKPLKDDGLNAKS